MMDVNYVYHNPRIFRIIAIHPLICSKHITISHTNELPVHWSHIVRQVYCRFTFTSIRCTNKFISQELSLWCAHIFSHWYVLYLLIFLLVVEGSAGDYAVGWSGIRVGTWHTAGHTCGWLECQKRPDWCCVRCLSAFQVRIMVLPTAYISISVSEIVIAMTSSVPVFIHVTSPVYVCEIVIYQIIILKTIYYTCKCST